LRALKRLSSLSRDAPGRLSLVSLVSLSRVPPSRSSVDPGGRRRRSRSTLATVRLAPPQGPSGLSRGFLGASVRGPRATRSDSTMRDGRSLGVSLRIAKLRWLIHGWADSRSVLLGCVAERHSKHTEPRAVLHMVADRVSKCWNDDLLREQAGRKLIWASTVLPPSTAPSWWGLHISLGLGESNLTDSEGGGNGEWMLPSSSLHNLSFMFPPKACKSLIQIDNGQPFANQRIGLMVWIR
jgi:hypothetical protein